MDLYAALMSGLVLATSMKSNNTPVDFILPGKGGVIVAAINWWLDPHGFADRVVLIEGDLQPSPTGWQLIRNDTVSVFFTSPDDYEQTRLTTYRLMCDLDRAGYLAALGNLAAHVPDFKDALDQWTTTVKQRPVPDPVAGVVAQHTRPREVGIVYLLDSYGEKVDALVIDRNGNYATRAGSAWLSSIGAQFGTSEPLPPIRDFLAWVCTQGPSDGTAVGLAEVKTEEGTLEGVALRSLPSIV